MYQIEPRTITPRGRNAGFYNKVTGYIVMPTLNNERRIPLLNARREPRYFETVESAERAAQVWAKQFEVAA